MVTHIEEPRFSPWQSVWPGIVAQPESMVSLLINKVVCHYHYALTASVMPGF